MGDYWDQLKELENEVDFNYKKWVNFYRSIEYLHYEVKNALERAQLYQWDANPFFSNVDTRNPLLYGQCGENVYWKIIDNVLYIGGDGDMWDFNPHDIENDDPDKFSPPWALSVYGSVVILNGVTSIGKYAFYSEGFDSIVIPASVRIIREGAFAYSHPRCLEIPPTVKTVEPYIIADDPCNIGKLIVSANIPNIAPEAFYTRFRGPDEIVLTGELPEDLSDLVKSAIFVWLEKKVSYPKSWDSDTVSFFDKLSCEIRLQGEEEPFLAYSEENFEKLRVILTPYTI